MEEDAPRLVQRHGDLSKTDGSGFDQDNEEVRESRDVLRGRRGRSDTNIGRSHRQTRRGLQMHEAGLKCKHSKCEILRDSIKYLGRMVDGHTAHEFPGICQLLSRAHEGIRR